MAAVNINLRKCVYFFITVELFTTLYIALQNIYLLLLLKINTNIIYYQTPNIFQSILVENDRNKFKPADSNKRINLIIISTDIMTPQFTFLKSTSKRDHFLKRAKLHKL